MSRMKPEWINPYFNVFLNLRHIRSIDADTGTIEFSDGTIKKYEPEVLFKMVHRLSSWQQVVDYDDNAPDSPNSPRKTK